MKFFNPPNITAPASRYSQGVVTVGNARRVVAAGQVGAAPDGRLEQGFEAQSRRAWSNLFEVLAHAGMSKRDLVKCVVFVTEAGRTAEFRAIRDEMLEGHAPCMTYLQVAGLAHPDMLVEIEGEAVAEPAP